MKELPITLGWTTQFDDVVIDNKFIKNNGQGWNSKFISSALPHVDLEIILKIEKIHEDSSGMAFGIIRQNDILDKCSLKSVKNEVMLNARGFE